MRIHQVKLVTGLVTVCAISLLCWAAPSGSGRIRFSDTDLSLAKIERVDLIVEPIPGPVREVGLTRDMLRDRMAERLEAAGFTVLKEEDVPKLGVLVAAVTDPGVPDGVAYSVNMVLTQRTKVERLDKSLFVPTHAQVMIGLESRDNLRKSLVTTIDALTHQWITISKLATEQSD